MLSRRQGKGKLGENERKRGKENAAVITLSLHLRKAKYLNYNRVKEEARRVEEMTEEKESEWQVRELLKCL